MISPDDLGHSVSKDRQSNTIYPLDITTAEFRDNILASQDFLVDATHAHVEPVVEHFFAPGMYGRQMTIEKDVLIVGKIHKHAHINIISKGVIDVITEFGVARYEAPITFVSQPETKRMVHAIEETIWTTIHATDEVDLDKIEHDVIAESYEDLNQ